MSQISRNIFVKISLLIFVAIFFATGCLNDSKEVTGLIIHFESFELDKLDKLTMKDSKGGIWVFEGGKKSFVDFSSHHLSEHQILGNPVMVRFEEQNGVLFIVSIKNADRNDH